MDLPAIAGNNVRPFGRICICGEFMSRLKMSIQQALEANDLDSIVSLAKKNRRVLTMLVRSAYDKETLAGWRAIKAVGLTAKALVKTDYEFLRETARKLLWSLSDESGGIGWSAPELLGEIVAVDPQRFSDIIPLIAGVYNIEENVFRSGVVYALGRIAEVSPELILPHRNIIMRALSETNPLTRVYALGVIRNTWRLESQDNRQLLRNLIKGMAPDKREVFTYHNNGFIRVEVGAESVNILSYLAKVG